EPRREYIEQRLRATEERFRLAQVAGGIGWVEWDLGTRRWGWSPYVATLFGFDPPDQRPYFAGCEEAILADELLKLRAAVESAAETGAYYAEIRVKHRDGSTHWIAGKGEATKDATGRLRWIAGVYYEITERKTLESRLLAVNETLEGRIAQLREETRILE